MTDNRKGKQPDWIIDLGSPAPVLSSEARASLIELSTLVEGCISVKDLLRSSERVNALVRDAVARGATEDHIATDMRLNLDEAKALVRGRSFDQLFSTE